MSNSQKERLPLQFQDVGGPGDLRGVNDLPSVGLQEPLWDLVENHGVLEQQVQEGPLGVTSGAHGRRVKSMLSSPLGPLNSEAPPLTAPADR